MSHMDFELLLVLPQDESTVTGSRLKIVLVFALSGRRYETAGTAEELEKYLRGIKEESKRGEKHRILFALPLGENGLNFEYFRILRCLRERSSALEGWLGALIIDSQSSLYTKSTARDLVFTANRAGCAFVGRPLVEGTETLSNFAIAAKNMGTDWMGAYRPSSWPGPPGRGPARPAPRCRRGG